MHPDTDRPDDLALVTLRRSDLAALAQSYRAAVHGRRQWVMVPVGLGGLALGPLMITLGEWLGWPDALAPVFFAIGWIILLGSLATTVVRGRRLRERYAFRCPACAAYLLGGPRAPVGTPRADLAIATGNCPACGARILEPDV